MSRGEEQFPDLAEYLMAKGRARDVLDLFDLPALPEQAELDWAGTLEQRVQQTGTEPSPEEAQRYQTMMTALIRAAVLYPPLTRADIQVARALEARRQQGTILSLSELQHLRSVLTRLLSEIAQL